jgi:hypothetical protein
MEKLQAFIAAKITGQNIYYPATVKGYNPETKAYQCFTVEDAQKWDLRKVLEQAGFTNVGFN